MSMKKLKSDIEETEAVKVTDVDWDHAEASAGNSVATPKPAFRPLRAVSVPTLRLEVGVPTYVRFMTEFVQDVREDEQQPGEYARADGMKAPHVCRVMVFNDDCKEVGEHSLVGGAVLVSILNDTYPRADYVGRIFEIIKMPRPKKDGADRVRTGGKADYFLYLVTEIVLDVL